MLSTAVLCARYLFERHAMFGADFMQGTDLFSFSHTKQHTALCKQNLPLYGEDPD